MRETEDRWGVQARERESRRTEPEREEEGKRGKEREKRERTKRKDRGIISRNEYSPLPSRFRLFLHFLFSLLRPAPCFPSLLQSSSFCASSACSSCVSLLLFHLLFLPIPFFFSESFSSQFLRHPLSSPQCPYPPLLFNR